jgi:hypothetical protein
MYYTVFKGVVKNRLVKLISRNDMVLINVSVNYETSFDLILENRCREKKDNVLKNELFYLLYLRKLYWTFFVAEYSNLSPRILFLSIGKRILVGEPRDNSFVNNSYYSSLTLLFFFYI